MSLPNGTVPMEFGSCETCQRGTISIDKPLGVNCGGCGHHFHIGVGILTETPPIFCPRCEGACVPFEITEPKEKT